MKAFREIIIENLITLRKKNGLTQLDLAKKLNYSDKAVSRWENGEVLPDVEVLNNIAEVYNVPFSYLFEEHKKEDKQDKENRMLKIFSCVASICIVWSLVTVLFVLITTFFEQYIWQIFIWAFPFSCIVVLQYNKKWWHKKLLSTIMLSLCLWSSITALYLQLIVHNIWMLYLVGIPSQITIMALYFTK